MSAPLAFTVTAGEQGAGLASCGDQGHQKGTFHTDCETWEVPEPREARLPDVGPLRAEGTEDRKVEQRERSSVNRAGLGGGAPSVANATSPHSTLAACEAGLGPPGHTDGPGRRRTQSHSSHWSSKTHAWRLEP